MRKVLHVGPCNTPGGMATVMHTLAEFPPEGWEAELLPSHAPGGLWAKWRAYRHARRELHQRCTDQAAKPDVVHVHTAADWSWRRKQRLIRLVRAENVPVVIHIHSGKFDRWLNGLNQRQQTSLREVFDEYATLGVVLSEGWRLRLDDALGPLVVVPNPVPIRFMPSPVARDSYHLLLLGRPDPVKRHAFGMELAKALRSEFPELRLSLTGINSSSETWIEALGWVSEDEKLRLLQTASVLLVPSSYEGQPMVMLEALSCGLPVCVSDRLLDVPDTVAVAKYEDVEDWCERVGALLAQPPDPTSVEAASSSFSPESVAALWKSHYESLIVRRSTSTKFR
jgi:glycosyltransferase involved in cell wall biosynthesis